MDVANDMIIPKLVDLVCSFRDEVDEVPDLLLAECALVYSPGLDLLL